MDIGLFPEKAVHSKWEKRNHETIWYRCLDRDSSDHRVTRYDLCLLQSLTICYNLCYFAISCCLRYYDLWPFLAISYPHKHKTNIRMSVCLKQIKSPANLKYTIFCSSACTFYHVFLILSGLFLVQFRNFTLFLFYY